MIVVVHAPCALDRCARSAAAGAGFTGFPSDGAEWCLDRPPRGFRGCRGSGCSATLAPAGPLGARRRKNYFLKRGRRDQCWVARATAMRCVVPGWARGSDLDRRCDRPPSSPLRRPAAPSMRTARPARRTTVRSPSNTALQQTMPDSEPRSLGNQFGPKGSSAALLGPPRAIIGGQLGAPASLLNAISLGGRAGGGSRHSGAWFTNGSP